jgi:hypothetical protein
MAETTTKQPAKTFVGASKVIQTDYPVRPPSIGSPMG